MKFLSRHLHTMILAFVLVAILALWIGHPSTMERRFPEGYHKLEPGTYGDMYGSLNTLFSGLAFSLLIYTALLQRSELKQQRQELETTRDVFKRQTEIQSEQLRLLEDESKRRLELEKISHSPKLMLRNFTWGGNAVSISLINGGAPIFDLRVIGYEPRSARSCVISPDTIIDRSSPAQIQYHFDRLPDDVTGRYSLELAYKDALNNQQEVALSVDHRENS